MRLLIRKPVTALMRCGEFVVTSDRISPMVTKYPESFVLIVHESLWDGIEDEWRVRWEQIEGVWFGVAGCSGGAVHCHDAAWQIEAVTGYRLLNYNSQSRDLDRALRVAAGISVNAFGFRPQFRPHLILQYQSGGYITIREFVRCVRTLRKRKAERCFICKKPSRKPVRSNRKVFCSQYCERQFEDKLCLLKDLKKELAKTPDQRHREALRIAKDAQLRIKKLLNPMSPGASRLLKEECERLETSLK